MMGRGSGSKEVESVKSSEGKVYEAYPRPGNQSQLLRCLAGENLLSAGALTLPVQAGLGAEYGSEVGSKAKTSSDGTL